MEYKNNTPSSSGKKSTEIKKNDISNKPMERKPEKNMKEFRIDIMKSTQQACELGQVLRINIILLINH